MDERELAKRIFRSKIDAGNVRGQPPVKWEDRVKGNEEKRMRRV